MLLYYGHATMHTTLPAQGRHCSAHWSRLAVLGCLCRVRCSARWLRLAVLGCLCRVQTHLSSDAFSSSTASLKFAPSNCRATAKMLVVLPVPGGPCRSRQHSCNRLGWGSAHKAVAYDIFRSWQCSVPAARWPNCSPSTQSCWPTARQGVSPMSCLSIMLHCICCCFWRRE